MFVLERCVLTSRFSQRSKAVRKQHSLGPTTSFATGAHVTVAESSDLISTGFFENDDSCTTCSASVHLRAVLISSFCRLGIILQRKSDWQVQHDASLQIVVHSVTGGMSR